MVWIDPLTRRSWRTALLSSLLLIVPALLPGASPANAAMLAVEYLLAETPEDVPPGPAADWRPFHPGSSLGFVAEPVWLRLRFDAEAAGGEPRYLIITPVHLDDVRIYALLDGTTPILRAGDRHPPIETVFQYGYSLLLEESHLREGLLVRLQSANIMQPQVRVVTPAELHQQNLRFYLTLT